MDNKKNTNNKKTPAKKHKKKRVPNFGRIIPWALGLLIVLGIIVFFIRIAVWDHGIEYIITKEDLDNIVLDTRDNVVLMPPSKLPDQTYDGKTTVLVLGNDSYFEGNDDNSGIIDYMESDIPDVEFINCCLPGSALNSYNLEEKSPSVCPEDYFTLFWLAFDITWNDFTRQEEALMYLDPLQYDTSRYQEVVRTLKSLDLASVDVVMFCYDGHDYRNGRLPINFVGEDAQTENIESLLGSLYTSIYLFNTYNPNIQYVYVSPAFCYGIDGNGEKVSCAMLDTGNGTIAETFNTANMVRDYYGISYIDMYSGVEVNEENADEYLEDDGITPNKKARRMMADRLVKLLNDRFVDRSSSDTK